MPYFKKELKNEDGKVVDTIFIELDHELHIAGAVSEGFEKTTKAEYEKAVK